MKISVFKSRRSKLKEKLKSVIQSREDINTILGYVDEYENANLNTIAKLKREKIVEIRRINGAIKQFLNNHPILTKELIGSLSKRIYGQLLANKKQKENIIKKYFKWIL